MIRTSVEACERRFIETEHQTRHPLPSPFDPYKCDESWYQISKWKPQSAFIVGLYSTFASYQNVSRKWEFSSPSTRVICHSRLIELFWVLFSVASLSSHVCMLRRGFMALWHVVDWLLINCFSSSLCGDETLSWDYEFAVLASNVMNWELKLSRARELTPLMVSLLNV